MIYGTPVPVLQKMLTLEDFAELMAYDSIYGLERHQEIKQPEQQKYDPQEMIKLRARKGDAAREWKPGPMSLNQQRGRSNATR